MQLFANSICRKEDLKPVAIHSQCFHQQVKVAAMVFKKLVRIIGKHETKLNNDFI